MLMRSSTPPTLHSWAAEASTARSIGAVVRLFSKPAKPYAPAKADALVRTGVYGYPKQPAAEIAVAAVNGFGNLEMLSDVVFVCFDAENLFLYKALLH